VEELIKTLPQILRSIGDDPEVATAAAATAWRRVAGDGLRQHAVPIALKEGALTVAVADAVWQKQLASMRDQLIFKTNSILGQPLVKRIEFVVDPKLAAPRGAKQEQTDQQIEVPLEILTAASTISDQQLRQKFVRAATSAMHERQKRQP
jgi:predicted nucleic acid-binding Zn ribbon protein